jgi:hypothetical protein
MNFQFDVKLDEISSKFSSYLPFIEKVGNNYKQYLRDIKLNTLLENKKVQFDIESIRQVYGCIGRPSEHPIAVLYIPESAFSVKSVHFIIKDDEVIKLTVSIDTLDNDRGKNVEKLMSLENVDISMCLYHKDGVIDKNSFYIDHINRKNLSN